MKIERDVCNNKVKVFEREREGERNREKEVRKFGNLKIIRFSEVYSTLTK